MFDKFMDEILLKEKKSQVKDRQKEETPQVKHAKLYREKPNNRIRFVTRGK